MRKPLVLVQVAAMAVAVWVATAPEAGSANPVPTTPTICNGLLSGPALGSVVVPSNAYCDLVNATVTGSVTVGSNASLKTCDSMIGGSLNATQAYVNVDNGTTIGGSVSLNRPGASLQMTGTVSCGEQGGLAEYSSILCPSRIGGGVSVHNGASGGLEVSIGECGPINPIGGTVSIQNNQLPVTIENSNILGSLICLNNMPPAVQLLNTVHGTVIGHCGQPL